MKKYYRVPLRIDPQPRVGYERNRGGQALENMRGNDNDREGTGRSDQVIFTQETFAEKIRILNPSWRPGARLAKMGELVRVFFRETPRAELCSYTGCPKKNALSELCGICVGTKFFSYFGYFEQASLQPSF